MSAKTTHLQFFKVMTQLGDLILSAWWAFRSLLLAGPVWHAAGCINSGRGLANAHVQVRLLCLWCSNEFVCQCCVHSQLQLRHDV